MALTDFLDLGRLRNSVFNTQPAGSVLNPNGRAHSVTLCGLVHLTWPLSRVKTPHSFVLRGHRHLLFAALNPPVAIVLEVAENTETNSLTVSEARSNVGTCLQDGVLLEVLTEGLLGPLPAFCWSPPSVSQQLVVHGHMPLRTPGIGYGTPPPSWHLQRILFEVRSRAQVLGLVLRRIGVGVGGYSLTCTTHE